MPDHGLVAAATSGIRATAVVFCSLDQVLVLWQCQVSLHFSLLDCKLQLPLFSSLVLMLPLVVTRHIYLWGRAVCSQLPYLALLQLILALKSTVAPKVHTLRLIGAI